MPWKGSPILVRMALGSDSGFGGAVGILALPGLLALLTAATAPKMAGGAVLRRGGGRGRDGCFANSIVVARWP